jgi:hypothetical protein
MPGDHDVVLDALANGLSIEAAADRFGLREAEVRDILKQETDRCYDGAEMRAEWTLTARRLRQLELVFGRKAIDDLDCAAAIVSIKASERRATLTGANAVQGHLVTIMHAAKAVEDEGTSTQKMLNAIRRLKAEHTAKPDADQEPLDQPN